MTPLPITQEIKHLLKLYGEPAFGLKKSAVKTRRGVYHIPVARGLSLCNQELFVINFGVTEDAKERFKLCKSCEKKAAKYE